LPVTMWCYVALSPTDQLSLAMPLHSQHDRALGLGDAADHA